MSPAPRKRRLGGPAPAIALVGALLALFASDASAGKLQTSPFGVQLRPIGNFDNPVFVTQAPGEPGTVYVVEQPGRVIAVRKGHRFRRPFLDINQRVRFGPEETGSNEAGLLSMAFDPNYASNGRFYVSTDASTSSTPGPEATTSSTSSGARARRSCAPTTSRASWC